VASSIIFLISFNWSGSFYFALSTGLAVLFNCSGAGVIGSMVPITFKVINIDPALVRVIYIGTLTSNVGCGAV
jgi:Mg/Co/Ni transporter MgtE